MDLLEAMAQISSYSVVVDFWAPFPDMIPSASFSQGVKSALISGNSDGAVPAVIMLKTVSALLSRPAWRGSGRIS